MIEICPVSGSLSLSSCMSIVPYTLTESRKRLDDDDFLIDAETMKHTQQVFSTA